MASRRRKQTRTVWETLRDVMAARRPPSPASTRVAAAQWVPRSRHPLPAGYDSWGVGCTKATSQVSGKNLILFLQMSDGTQGSGTCPVADKPSAYRQQIGKGAVKMLPSMLPKPAL